jgi:hypothetical protein
MESILKQMNTDTLSFIHFKTIEECDEFIEYIVSYNLYIIYIGVPHKRRKFYLI